MIRVITALFIFIILISYIKAFNKEFFSKNQKINEDNNLKNKSVVIAGCAKDIEKDIHITTKKMFDISKLFKKSRIIIFENDSKDNTLKILRDFEKQHDNVIVLSESGLSTKKDYTRTCKLAYARNKILQQIEIENLYDYDFYINLDLDNVNKNLNIKTVKEQIENNNFEWDVLTANQPRYYDYWALRTKKYNKNCWSKNELCINKKMLLSNWFDNLVNTNGNTEYSININNPPIQILSGFGGLGIYKLKSIKGCKYDSNKLKDVRLNDCEHVFFHKCITDKGGKIFIAPKLINKT